MEKMFKILTQIKTQFFHLKLVKIVIITLTPDPGNVGSEQGHPEDRFRGEPATGKEIS
jgi:hypothetical protein